MVEIHYCENCDDHHAEIVLTGPGGESTYLCTAPECMMAAGICPSCQVDLEIHDTETGETMYSCPDCDYERTREEIGQA